MQNNLAEIIEQLSDKVMQLEQQNAELNARLKWYEEQFRLSRQKQFAASSEKTETDQLNLFNEAEDTANPQKEEPTLETITCQRRKNRPGRGPTGKTAVPDGIRACCWCTSGPLCKPAWRGRQACRARSARAFAL